MSSHEYTTGAESGSKGMDIPIDPIESRKTYAVVLDSFRDNIETIDSFAIKFSLLTKMPLAKAKHFVRHLPAKMWVGEGRQRAERVLALIEEAGGRGSVHEVGAKPVEEAPAKAPAERPSCTYCGFPLNEGDAICGFCRTPVGTVPPSSNAVAEAPAAESAASETARGPLVSRKLLLVCGAVLVAGVIVLLALR